MQIMNNLSLHLLSVCFLLRVSGFSQTFGTAKAPEDLLKATLLLETAQTTTNTKYFPFGIFRGEGGKTIQLSPTNLVVLQYPEAKAAIARALGK